MTTLSQIDNSKLPENADRWSHVHLSCGIQWNIMPSTSIPPNSQLSLKVRMLTVFIEPTLYFSKREQSFDLPTLITHVMDSGYLYFYVTMPQAGFEPPR